MDCFLLRGIVILVLALSFTPAYADETTLRAFLQTSYDRYARPAIPTNVTIYYSLRSLKHLDIIDESMMTTGFMSLIWYDTRLAWTPSSYSNITSVDVNWAWRPEFIIGNSVDDIQTIGYDDDETRMTIFYTGEVLWGVYFATQSSCKIDTSNFPHDQQTCNIEAVFLNQNYDTNLIVTLPYTKIDRSILLENGEWDWVDSSYDTHIFTLCCPTIKVLSLRFTMTFSRRQSFYIINILLPIILLSFCVPWAFYINTENGEWDWVDSSYDTHIYTLCCPTLKVLSLRFTMMFSRRQSFYIINILLPIILLSFCVPWAFYINTDSGDRSGYALTMLLSYFVFLGVVSELIPSTSLNTPVLAEYLLAVLVLCSIALICVTIQVKLFFLETPPSKMARRVYKVVRCILNVKCCGKKHETPVRPVTAASVHVKRPLPEDEERNCPSGSGSDLTEDITWQCITITCDRFLFYLYNVAVFVCNMALVIALYK